MPNKTRRSNYCLHLASGEVALTLYVPPELKDALLDIADDQGRRLKYVATDALSAYARENWNRDGSDASF